MKRLLLETSVPKIYMLVMISISVLMLGGYFSYAMFTVQKEKKSAINIVTGNLTGTLTVDGASSNKLVVPANTSKTFTVVLSNNNARKARYNFYYTGTLASNISAGYIVEEGINTPPSATGVILEASGTAGSSVNYKIKVKNNTSNNITIPLGYEVGLENIDLTLPSNSKLFTEMPKEPTMVETLLASYTNPISVTTYSSGNKSKLYTFQQQAGEQQVGYTSNELKDYRYIGNQPNNYIKFNDEVWRIIGIFTVENKDGKKEQRIKIVRNDSIGSYSFDTTKVEDTFGKNRWSDAQIMKLLNAGYQGESIGGSKYWNRGKGYCYSHFGENNGTTACDFTSTGLSNEAKNKIEETKWYLGGYQIQYAQPDKVYVHERNNIVYNSTAFPREPSWIGSVGLLYPSDYGYTYSLDVDDICYKNLPNCSKGNPNSGWLYKNTNYYFMTPYTTSSYQVYSVVSDLSFSYAYVDNNIHPVVYLKANVVLASGTGTSSDPFIIS